MKVNEISGKLAAIANDMEEIIGIGLGKAPANFYDENENGDQVAFIAKMRPFANKADKALKDLLDLTLQVKKL